MSDEPAGQQPVETAREEPDKPSRIAGGLVVAVAAGVAVLVLKAVVTVAPYSAYFVAGILVTVGWQKVRGWFRRRRGGDEEEDEQDRETLAETMHRLAGPHVFLADLAVERGLSKEAARALLEALGVRVRRAVRNGNRTAVGVHKDDLPPLPRPSSAPPVGGVDLQQQHNQQGVRVERTHGGMVTIYDLSETQRHHRVQ